VSSVLGGVPFVICDGFESVPSTARVSLSVFVFVVLSLVITAPFSGICGKDVEESAGPSKLVESILFFVSNRRKSGVLEGLSVPPNIVSRASWVDADDFGTRGQEPYQLRALRTCFCAFGGVFLVSLPLLSLTRGIGRVGRLVGSETATAVTCDVADVAIAGAIAAGGLDELGFAGAVRWRFRGDMVEIERGRESSVLDESRASVWEVNLPHVRFKKPTFGG